MTDRGRLRRRGLVAAIFFFSGASSLLYQTVWLKNLGYVFGNTVYATATLVAIFLGGLGIGAWIFGKRFRSRSPLLVYAVVEAFIGVIGAFSPWIFKLLDTIYVSTWSSLADSPGAVALMRIVVSSLFLLPPTILMGGTLPVLIRWWEDVVESSGRAIASLYSINTFGAAAGVAIGGFVLIPKLGLVRTLVVAVATNFVLSVAAVLIARIRSSSRGAEETATLQEETGSAYGLGARAVLLVAFLTGMVAISNEIFWTRILVLHLGSSVYAFSLMLFGFLIGIALGSAAARTRWPRTHPVAALGALQATLGVVLAFQVWYFTKLSDVLGHLAEIVRPTDYAETFLVLLTGVLTAVIPPTLLMGATFPLVVLLYELITKNSESSATGSVYLWNTLGSIVGSLAAGFFLIRTLGSQNGIFATAVVSMMLAAFLILPSGRLAGSTRRALVTMLVVAVGALSIGWMLIDRDAVIYTAGIYEGERSKIRMMREDTSATVVLREVGDGLWLELNGVNVAGTARDLVGTQMLQGHLPLMIHEDPRRVLHIGFGSGGTAYSVSRHPVEAIVIAEISPEVLESSDRYLRSVNHGVLEDPRVETVINDGRNFVLATPEKFDVILSDSIHPRFAGNGSLYTLDYFRLCRDRLEEDGVVSMWLPIYTMTTKNYLEILAAFREVFPDTTVWYVPDTLNAFTIVIGKMSPGPPSLAELGAQLKGEAASELGGIGVDDSAELASMLVLDPFGVEKLTRDVAPHRDDRPTIEYESGRLMRRDLSWYRNFRMLVLESTPLRRAFRDADPGTIAEAERLRRERFLLHLSILESRLVKEPAASDPAQPLQR